MSPAITPEEGATVIDWLNPRSHRQFPYERYNRWSQSPDEKRRWTKALEAENVEAVRRALQKSRAGPPGLIRIGDESMTQGFAEKWLDWHDSRKPNWSKRGVLLALLIAIVGFVGWLLGWR
jgi:hypothetical protein